MAIRIEDDVLAVLDAAEVEGSAVRLTGQLDRGLYERVNKVLAAAGGRWNRKARAHLFDESPAETLEQVMQTGQIVAVKQELGQFDSPPEVVARLMELAEIEPGMRVLEPSAGVGNIVAELLPHQIEIVAVEIDPKRFRKLDELVGLERRRRAPRRRLLYCADILEWLSDPGDPNLHGIAFDRIVMNPPFARQEDIRHVMSVASFLKPGGRLISVMGAGVRFRENRLALEFRQFLQEHNGRIENLPEGAFRSSGTLVNSVIVTLEGRP